MSDFAAALVLLGFLAVIPGFLILINPAICRVKSRWFALPVCLLVFGFAGLAMMISPDPAAGPTADTRTSGAILVGLWCVVMVAAWYLSRSGSPAEWFRALRASWAEDVARARIRQEERLNRENEVRAVDAAPPRRIRRKAKPRIDFDPDGPTSSDGKSAAFVYVDAQGEITDREVLNWSIDGAYFKGFCTRALAVRTFRLDRVIEWKRWA